MRMWRNWQTRWLQVPVAAMPCGFKSRHLDHRGILTNGLVKPNVRILFYPGMRFGLYLVFIRPELVLPVPDFLKNFEKNDHAGNGIGAFFFLLKSSASVMISLVLA